MDTLEVIKYLEFGSYIIGKSTKVTPEIAADVLLLADRHCLSGLKQVETECNIFLFRNLQGVFLTQSFTLMFMLRR